MALAVAVLVLITQNWDMEIAQKARSQDVNALTNVSLVIKALAMTRIVMESTIQFWDTVVVSMGHMRDVIVKTCAAPPWGIVIIVKV
jgi:hypothetical protein